jgi:hypothetical protein
MAPKLAIDTMKYVLQVVPAIWAAGCSLWRKRT